MNLLSNARSFLAFPAPQRCDAIDVGHLETYTFYALDAARPF